MGILDGIRVSVVFYECDKMKVVGLFCCEW